MLSKPSKLRFVKKSWDKFQPCYKPQGRVTVDTHSHLLCPGQHRANNQALNNPFLWLPSRSTQQRWELIQLTYFKWELHKPSPGMDLRFRNQRKGKKGGMHPNPNPNSALSLEGHNLGLPSLGPVRKGRLYPSPSPNNKNWFLTKANLSFQIINFAE